MGKHFSLTAADKHQLGAYRADPKGAPKGSIVVIQEIFGVNSHIRAVCDRLAESAERAHDAEAQKLIQDLRDRAWEIFWKKTGRRPGSLAGRSEADEAKAPRESNTSTASPRRGKP